MSEQLGLVQKLGPKDTRFAAERQSVRRWAQQLTLNR